MLCVVLPYTLNPMTTIIELLRLYASKIIIWDWSNPKYWPNLAICCVLYFSVTPNFEIIRCCVYKILKVTSSDLGNQCFETCSWTPLTMVKSFLSNSTLLEITIPALAFNCSYASSAKNKTLNTLTVYGIRLHLRIQLTFCEIHLQLRNPKQLAVFACSRIRDTQNVPRKFT